MKTEDIRLCEYCHGIVPGSRNKNSKFCCDGCYSRNKAEFSVIIQKKSTSFIDVKK